MVSDICWKHIVSKTGDVNYSVCELANLFSLTFAKHALLSQIRVFEKCSPWINSEIETLKRTRDRLKKTAVKSKSSALTRSYRKARNVTNNFNTQFKKKHYT